MLTAEDFQAITNTIEAATGLPNRAYRDADWAVAERDNVLANKPSQSTTELNGTRCRKAGGRFFWKT